MDTPLAHPALAALRTIDMRTGRTRVAAILLGPAQPAVEPLAGRQGQVFDLVAYRRQRIQQPAHLTVGEGAVQMDNRGG